MNSLLTFVLLASLTLTIETRHQYAGRHKEKSQVPRFVIPSKSEETVQKPSGLPAPEVINIVKKSGSIKGSALPGAFGEDDGLGDIFEESGSGSGSGSGDVEPLHQIKQDIHHDKTAENAANFGNNVAPKVGINPSSAFITIEPNHKGFKGGDATIEHKHKQGIKKHKKPKVVKKKKKAHKKSKAFKKEKLIIKKEKSNTKKKTKPDIKIKIAAKNSEKTESKIKKYKNKNNDADDDDDDGEDDSGHQKDKYIMSQIQNIAKQIDAVEKKRAQEGKTKKEKNSKVKTKMSSAIDKLEEDISKFRLSKETVSTKNTVDNKQKLNGNSSQTVGNATEKYGADETAQASGYEEVPEDLSLQKHVVNHGEAGGPEGFQCPWVCYWTCHSYCPKDCCNNPFKCHPQCKEFCTPYCKDKCCAPGARRLPKLALTFRTKAETGQKPEQHLNQTMATEKNKQQARTETSEIASEIEALKQASTFAAQALGLPNSCPIFCPRICTPGLCKAECCNRNKLPAIAETKQAPYISPARPIPPHIEPVVNSAALKVQTFSSTQGRQAPSPQMPAQSAQTTKIYPAAPAAPVQSAKANQALSTPASAQVQTAKAPPPSAQALPAPSTAAAQQSAPQAPVVAQNPSTLTLPSVLLTSEPAVAVPAAPGAPIATAVNIEPVGSVDPSQQTESFLPESATNQILPAQTFSESQEVPIKQTEVGKQEAQIIPSVESNELAPAEATSQTTEPESATHIQVPTTNIQLPPSSNTAEHSAIEQAAGILPAAPSTQTFYCPTPINCPEGAVVDPDYCPPICRTACIEQCPNECCPNNGRPVVQPKH